MRSLNVLGLLVAAAVALGPATPVASAMPPYSLKDIGTLGGPQAFLNLPGGPLTNDGEVLGTADTAIADPNYPNFNPFLVGFADPFVAQAFAWRDGKLTNLGALPGDNGSTVVQINARGVGAGVSETGALDPHAGYPVEHAVIYKHGAVIDLGTLPGGSESLAGWITDGGIVAGFANNAIPDPVSFFAFAGWTTQTRTFVWHNGELRDIGSLGGPDTALTMMNARGQLAGDSYLNATPGDTGSPPTDPFLWTNGHMRDLGTLGGTQSITNWLNDRGEVVGQDNLAGDQSFHPYLWDGRRLRDLGTFGGDSGAATYINDAGTIVGWATVPGDSTAHAFVWKHGTMTDLSGPTSQQCTFANTMNNRGQIVGGTCDGTDALLWANGHQYDLNTLIPPADGQLQEAVAINDAGQILTKGALPDGSQRVFLLSPQSPLPAIAAGPAVHRGGMDRLVDLSAARHGRAALR